MTTKSGQRAVIEIIREFRYPVEWEKDSEKKGQWVPTSFETRNTGVTLAVEPTIGADKVIDLLLTPQVVEYLGAVDVDTGKPVKNPALPLPLASPSAGLAGLRVALNFPVGAVEFVPSRRRFRGGVAPGLPFAE